MSPRGAAGTADDTSTPHGAERREGQDQAQAHTGHTSPDQGRATELLGQAHANRAAATAAAPANATAALSHPTSWERGDRRQGDPKAAPCGPGRPRYEAQGPDLGPPPMTTSNTWQQRNVPAESLRRVALH